MARHNKTEFAVLGLLLSGARTGYDIRKMVSEVLSHFWHESYGHLYPMLARMEKRGWLTRTSERGVQGPARNVYTVTAAGRAAFQNWFDEDVEPLPPRNELLLRLFFGRLTSDKVLVKQVKTFRERQSSGHQMLAGIRQAVSTESEAARDRRYWLLTMRMGELVTGALVQWADEALKELT